MILLLEKTDEKHCLSSCIYCNDLLFFLKDYSYFFCLKGRTNIHKINNE